MHRLAGIKPSFIGSQTVDGAGNAALSVKYLQWRTPANAASPLPLTPALFTVYRLRQSRSPERASTRPISNWIPPHHPSISFTSGTSSSEITLNQKPHSRTHTTRRDGRSTSPSSLPLSHAGCLGTVRPSWRRVSQEVFNGGQLDGL